MPGVLDGEGPRIGFSINRETVGSRGWSRLGFADGEGRKEDEKILGGEHFDR